MVKAYYALIKPGIVRGNAITATAGFFLASGSTINWLLCIYMLVGICLVMASGCVFNNYIDRGIDRKMARTKQRALVTGAIPVRHALAFATALGLLGALILGWGANPLTMAIAALGWVFYVVLYGIAKRRTVHGTLVGSVSGAVPPVVGYVAVSAHLDIGALLVFIILVLWQMPHFYAIAMYRQKDYAAAGLPVLPIVAGLKTTKFVILAYIAAFAATTTSLTIAGYTGIIYLVVMLAISFNWLYIGIKGFHTTNNVQWARRMFGYSLLVLLSWSVLVSLHVLLP